MSGKPITTKKNPILLVLNNGYGDTPVPESALLKLGTELNIHDENTGKQDIATVIAVVPAGVPPEFAIADQAEPKQVRPLIMSMECQREISYVLRKGEENLLVLERVISRGIKKAAEAGL